MIRLGYERKVITDRCSWRRCIGVYSRRKRVIWNMLGACEPRESFRTTTLRDTLGTTFPRQFSQAFPTCRISLLHQVTFHAGCKSMRPRSSDVSQKVPMIHAPLMHWPIDAQWVCRIRVRTLYRIRICRPDVGFNTSRVCWTDLFPHEGELQESVWRLLSTRLHMPVCSRV